MYPISPLYATYLKRHDREFKVKANIAGAEYDDSSIVDFTIENSLAMSDEFEIGTAIKSKLTIRLRTQSLIPPNARIVPYLALALSDITWQDTDFAWQDADFAWDGGTTSWLPMGEFYVDSREKINDVWVFTCYDKLVWADVPYVSSLSYPTSQQAVWNEICTRLGYTYDSSVVINPAYQIQAGPAGYSYRQVMAYIASANSASVFVSKDGKIKFKRYTAADQPVDELTTADYYRSKQTNPIKTYTRVVVTYNTEDGLTYEAGSGDDNHTLYVENPFATQAVTNGLLSALNGLSYTPVSMDARGFPQYEHGDCVGYQSDEGGTWEGTEIPWQDMNVSWDGLVRYKTYILHKVYSFKGGLKMSIEAPSKSEQQSEFVVEGSLSQQVNRLNSTSVKQGKSYYGVTITRTAGITVEREDHASKAVFNSDELTFYKGGSKALWFDVPTNTYKFTGVIEASSFVGGNIVIGSGNNVFKADSTGIWAGNANFANAPFSVNMNGKMKAVGAEFSGTISASTINGGTITGSLIQTSASYPRSEMSVTGNLFGSYSSASKSVTIEAINGFSSSPGIVFRDIGINAYMYADAPYDELSIFTPNNMNIGANGSRGIILNGTRVSVRNWGVFVNGDTNQTLQQAFNSKASAGVSTGLSGGHNHGIPDGTVLRTADGGTVTFFAASQHSHSQT